MKQYLLVDCSDSYDSSLKSYKDLKYMYADEYRRDILENSDDEDVLRNGLNVLFDMALGKEPSIKDIQDTITGDYYKIIDLLELQRDIEDVKNYYENKKCYTHDFDVVLTFINNLVNKGE